MKKHNIIVATCMALSLLHLMSCNQGENHGFLAYDDTLVVHDTLIGRVQ